MDRFLGAVFFQFGQRWVSDRDELREGPLRLRNHPIFFVTDRSFYPQDQRSNLMMNTPMMHFLQVSLVLNNSGKYR